MKKTAILFSIFAHSSEDDLAESKPKWNLHESIIHPLKSRSINGQGNHVQF